MSEHAVGLFPLGLVLVPGMLLPLRIFEPRYITLVRDCAREGRPFGVVSVQRSEEASDAAPVPAGIGTLAYIVDFYRTADGLLGINVLGGERFQTLHGSVREDGLLTGQVHVLDEGPALPLAAEFGLLGSLVHGLVEHVGGHHAETAGQRRDDARWVSWRLVEFLPLTLAEKQQMLQTGDPEARLRQLIEWLPRFQSE